MNQVTVKHIGLTSCSMLAWLVVGCVVVAEDWPTYRHDQQRSGYTTESIDAAKLTVAWQWKSAVAPSPAWPDSARWDAYATLDGLRSMRNYDPVFHGIVVGEKLYLPSNSDHALRCFELSNGKLLWNFVAEAPIRIAPVALNQKVYFTCDRGLVYALDANSGSLVWKKQVGTATDCFINDGRICSFEPIRSGALIDQDAGVCIVACGMFPWKDSQLVALDITTGQEKWRKNLGTGWTLEGAMLLGNQQIIAPQGRAAPQVFNRANGESIGPLEGGGGSFVLLTNENEVLHGPGNKGGWITQSKVNNREKVASFEKGTAIVVDDGRSYLLDEERLSALDRKTGIIQWVVPCNCPHELILAGETLFAGGNDLLKAYDRQSGKLLWQGQVEGRVFGLLVANGHLIASTDEGNISVFAPSGAPQQHESTVIQPDTERPFSTLLPAPVPATIADSSLMNRWVFHGDEIMSNPMSKKQLAIRKYRSTLDRSSLSPETLTHDESEGQFVALSKNAKLVQVGQEHALALDGRTEGLIAKDYKLANYPKRAFTVSAWVRIDHPQPWGGIVSITQDNGDYEKGWILGYRNQQFGFAVNAENAPDKLTWVGESSSSFIPGAWYLVTGVYDGSTIKLYVNDQLVGESAEQIGNILYPEKASWIVGAYHDDDENFPSLGMLNEVRVYDRAVTTEEVTASYEEKKDNFPEPAPADELMSKSKYAGTVESSIYRGPFAKFVRPKVIEVLWWTATPQPTVLEVSEHPNSAAQANVLTAGTANLEHRVEIGPIRTHEIIKYRLGHLVSDKPVWTGEFECDGHFDMTTIAEATVPTETAAHEIAAGLWKQMARSEPKGLGVVIGAQNLGHFANAIQTLSHYDILVFDTDAGNVQAAREHWISNGRYGRQLQFIHVEDFAALPIPNHSVDFLLVDPAFTVTNDPKDSNSIEYNDILEFIAKLQPSAQLLASSDLLVGDFSRLADTKGIESTEIAGRSFAGFQKLQFDGASDWTHMYGSADNSAYKGETLSGAKRQEDLKLVWAGRPGPRYQSDRGNRKPSPLASGGRLYMQGLRRILAVDAYNGTILWNQELPEVVRFNVPRDCSNWCADNENLFVAAGNRCLVLRGADGHVERQLTVLNQTNPEFHWGFVSRVDDLLVGSAVAPGSAFTEFWGGENWYDSKDGEHAKKVCSDLLFVADPQSGQPKWVYSESLIVNPTITIHQGRIYFLGCKSQTLKNEKNRRLDGDEFWNSMHLIAIDLKTGEKIWDTPARPMAGVSAVYMAASADKLVLTTSNDGAFGVYAINASNGEIVWRGKYKWEVDHHGKHLSRPAIVGGRIYLRPLTLDLNNGDVLSQEFPKGHQCGTYTASQNALFLRAGELAMWDRESGYSTRWSRVRPDCWISTIPAQGMLLSPEGGGGCSCGGWIETSMAFAPLNRQQTNSTKQETAETESGQ